MDPNAATPHPQGSTPAGRTPAGPQAAALRRSFNLSSLTLFGLAYLAPLVVLGTFGVIAVRSGGAAAGSYLLALVAMLFTALSYGRMAAAFPQAGASYNFVRRNIDPRLGFLVGWASILDYFFLPMVIWLIGASFLSAGFPAVPFWVWIAGFILLTTALNVVGVAVAKGANILLMAFQLLVIVLFIGFAVAAVTLEDGVRGLFSLDPFFNPGTDFERISAGAAVAAYSFLGFDAVAAMADDTRNPARVLPRAIVLVALIGGVIFIVLSYVTELAHPGTDFTDEGSAAFEIAEQIGGALFSAVFLAGLVVTQFASGLAAQSSASRLLYAMGRSDSLPRRIFGYVSPRFRTPVLNVLLCGLVGCVAFFLDESTSTSFINFGAFIAFTLVNACCVFYWVHQRRQGVRLNPLAYIAAPAVGAVISIYLWLNLDVPAKILGSIWLALGIIYLVWLTRGFRRDPPGMQVD